MKISVASTLALSLALGASATPVKGNAARQAPALQGGFMDHCDFYQVTNHGEAYGHLQAQCNLDPGNPETEVATTLDLSLCLGNYNDHLDWGYLGGAFASCQGCTSRQFETQYLDCGCGSVNLNDGIYVTDGGAVACYDQVGSISPVPY